MWVVLRSQRRTELRAWWVEVAAQFALFHAPNIAIIIIMNVLAHSRSTDRPLSLVHEAAAVVFRGWQCHVTHLHPRL